MNAALADGRAHAASSPLRRSPATGSSIRSAAGSARSRRRSTTPPSSPAFGSSSTRRTRSTSRGTPRGVKRRSRGVGPELVFENDWRAPIVMRLVVKGTSITVRFYSQRLGRRVTSWTGRPHDYVSPTVRVVHNPSLRLGTRRVVQPAGSSGFTIEYGRRVYRGRCCFASSAGATATTPKTRSSKSGHDRRPARSGAQCARPERLERGPPRIGWRRGIRAHGNAAWLGDTQSPVPKSALARRAHSERGQSCRRLPVQRLRAARRRATEATLAQGTGTAACRSAVCAVSHHVA